MYHESILFIQPLTKNESQNRLSTSFLLEEQGRGGTRDGEMPMPLE